MPYGDIYAHMQAIFFARLNLHYWSGKRNRHIPVIQVHTKKMTLAENLDLEEYITAKLDLLFACKFCLSTNKSRLCAVDGWIGNRY